MTDHAITRTEPKRFEQETKSLIETAEKHRIGFMNAFQKRELAAANIAILCVFVFGCAFGYFLYIAADPIKAVACIFIALTVPLAINIWSRAPIGHYIADYKKSFMPHMAHALGGFKFHPKRGISSKILPKTGVVPGHEDYQAEDCFIGTYKGVKVILSEARLKRKKKMVFDGVFVLLDVPGKPFSGHTIISNDTTLINRYQMTRWKSLKRADSVDEFGLQVFTNKPEQAETIVTASLLKELGEAGNAFDSAPITAVLFNKKYVFLSIPYDGDMFEPSSIFLPVSSPDHAETCRREIEQILEIIDVFDVYQKTS